MSEEEKKKLLPLPVYHRTTDYSIFTLNERNRKVNKKSVRYRNLKESMEEYGWLPIFPLGCVRVGTKLILLEGHRRFAIAQELKIPVVYVICELPPGVSISKINAGQDIWHLMDWVTSYAPVNEHYRKLQRFFERWNLPLSICAALLSGRSLYCGGGWLARDISEGKFMVTDEKNAERMGMVCSTLAQINRTVARKNLFVGALMRAVKVAEFNVLLFMEKAKRYAPRFTHQYGIEGYLQMIEDIYNFKSRQPVPIVFTVNQVLVRQSRQNQQKEIKETRQMAASPMPTQKSFLMKETAHGIIYTKK